MKRPHIEDGKTIPWWLLLYEYERYLSAFEKALEKKNPHLLSNIQAKLESEV